MAHLQILSRDEAARSGIAWPDVYFSQGYGAAVEHSDRAPWFVAVWDRGPIVMPFLLREIESPGDAQRNSAGGSSLSNNSSRVAGAGPKGSPGPEITGASRCSSPGHPPDRDIVSPYGYSGCWAPASLPREEWVAFRRAFRDEMRERGVVSELLRLGSLVPGREALLDADPELRATRHNDTIAVDTPPDQEIYWNNCEGRARTAVRKALKLGYTAAASQVIAEDLQSGSRFRSLYEATMQRVAAAEYYRFNDTYFDALFANLQDKLWMFSASRADGSVAVMALTMAWPPFLHLHLSGSEQDATRDGAGNLCYDAMIRWACEHPAIHQCHLGGGLAADDALFRFKKSFGGRRLPFWIASSVFNEERYRELVRRRAEQLNCNDQALDSADYFPAYRATASIVRPAA